MHNPESGVTPGSHLPPPRLVQHPREAVGPTWLSLDSHLGSSPNTASWALPLTKESKSPGHGPGNLSF